MPEDGEFTENDIEKYVSEVRGYEDHFEWLLILNLDARKELASNKAFFLRRSSSK